MAGDFKLLFEQEFSATDTIVVNHSLDRYKLAVLVSVDGETDGNHIQDITLDSADPRNSLTVTLTSPLTGTIKIVDSGPCWANLPSPAEKAALPTGNPYVTTQDTSTVAISDTADTILLSVALDNPNELPVKIMATIRFDIGSGNPNPRQIAFKLFRDGTEIDSSDRYTPDLRRQRNYVVTFHWVDTASGTNPIYTVRAVSENTNDSATTNRRLTAFT